MIKSPDKVVRLAAVLIRDPVLALDVEQALSTAGYMSWVNHDYSVAGLEKDSHAFAFAIVDLSLRDGRPELAMEWLEEQQIRTIVLATGEERASGPAGNGIEAPHVVVRFLKPFVVDEILPFVQDGVATVGTSHSR